MQRSAGVRSPWTAFTCASQGREFGDRVGELGEDRALNELAQQQPLMPSWIALDAVTALDAVLAILPYSMVATGWSLDSLQHSRGCGLVTITETGISISGYARSRRTVAWKRWHDLTSQSQGSDGVGSFKAQTFEQARRILYRVVRRVRGQLWFH